MSDTNTGEGWSFDEAILDALVKRKEAGYDERETSVLDHVVRLSGNRTDRVWHVVHVRGIK